MRDDTIAPALYKTGQGDRAIPLTLALGGVVTVPLVLWAAGPFWWPWGVVSAVVVALASMASLARWWQALETVVWSEGLLEFRRGNRVLTLNSSALTQVEVRPCAVHTRLRAGPHRWRLSHRLVRVEDLLDQLRLARPDLFAEAGDELSWRTSAVGSVFQTALGLATGLAAWLVAEWAPPLALVFAASAALALVRLFWSIPRAYTIREGSLTVHYLLRRKRWGRPRSIREDAYAASGAVFYRMRLMFGSRSVVLDEGHLVRPLRPWADRVVAALSPSP